MKVSNIAFGSGRRACPGYYFPEGTMFATVATVLAICRPLMSTDVRLSLKLASRREQSCQTFNPKANECCAAPTEMHSAPRKMSSVHSARDKDA
ncbi:hypothetical protein IEO21_06977 [Rhodonia placenta]|uniref:Cytochrome P450 n=2 Tax=Rhodonia placenta TaxID=104341 RepID=A0A8H7NZ79_9APHY|nr:hypothetical protein IEO21_06977 [Postia placenta]